jgi:curved DNA binding protein
MIKLTDPIGQLNDQSTLQKYKIAGLIATKTIDEIIKNTKVGSKLFDLVNIGENYIRNELKKVFTEIKDKGQSFPICLSLNNIAGHYIPLSNEIIQDGDILKIELGVHIDGFPANIVFSTLVTSDNTIINDKRSNVMKGCIEASKEIIKIMKPGNTNKDVSNIMQKYAEKYNCNLPIYNESGIVPGVLSYQISRYVVDGSNDDDDEFIHRFILCKDNPNYEYTMRENEFEENEIYSIDILMSTGSCKLQNIDKTAIFKRNHKNRFPLKLKSSKDALSLFNKGMFPIKIDISNVKIKLGLKECLEKNLIEKYPVVCDKEGEYIARVKFTVIVKENPVLICGKSSDSELKKLV